MCIDVFDRRLIILYYYTITKIIYYYIIFLYYNYIIIYHNVLIVRSGALGKERQQLKTLKHINCAFRKPYESVVDVE